MSRRTPGMWRRVAGDAVGSTRGRSRLRPTSSSLHPWRRLAVGPEDDLDAAVHLVPEGSVHAGTVGQHGGDSKGGTHGTPAERQRRNARKLSGSPGPLPGIPSESLLAKPNYSFEKRQRELAKKKKQEQKQEQKRLQKLAKSSSESAPQPADPAEPPEPGKA